MKPLIQRWARPALMIYAPVLFLSTHWPDLSIKINKTQELGDVNLDKPVHAGAMAVLAALTILVRFAGPQATWLRNIVIGTLVAAAFAYVDELSQQYVGRTTSSADLLANLSGVSVAMIVAMGLCRSAAVNQRLQAGAALLLVLFLPAVLIMATFPMMALKVAWQKHQIQGGLRYGDVRMLIAFIAGAAACLLGYLAWPAVTRTLSKLLGSLMLLALVIAGLMSLNPSRSADSFVDLGIGLLGVLIALMMLLAMRTANRSVAKMSHIVQTAPIAPAAARPVQQTQQQFVGNAKVVSILTFVSRLTGLARESVMAAVFGLSPVAAAFVFAFQIPNLFRRLFGEGALSAALIPVYAKLLHEDQQIARRFVWLVLSLAMVILGSLTLIGELAVWAALHARDWSPEMVLAIKLTMMMLPYMPLVCLVAIIGAVLQVQGRFASTAAAPILLNIVVVTAAILATRSSNESQLVQSIYWVSASVIAAGLLQLGWQLIALLKQEKPVMNFAGTQPAMTSLKVIFLPMVVGLAAFQLNTFMDSLMAMALSAKQGATHFTLGHASIAYPLEEASVAALNWSQRLYEFPLGIFGIAIATAIFPALSHAAANRASQGLTHFTSIYHHGLRLSVFIGLPASIGLMVVALPLSRLAYERGQFTFEDSQRVAWILLGYAPAIWAYSMNHVLTRAFYALGDSRTPVKVSLAMVGMNLLLNLILVWPLGAQGFAIATAAGAILQSVILILAMALYLREPLGREVWMSWGKSLLAACVMGLSLLAVYLWISPADLRPRDNFILLMAMVIGGVLIYTLVAWLTRCPEIRWLLRRKAGA